MQKYLNRTTCVWWWTRPPWSNQDVKTPWNQSTNHLKMKCQDTIISEVEGTCTWGCGISEDAAATYPTGLSQVCLSKNTGNQWGFIEKMERKKTDFHVFSELYFPLHPDSSSSPTWPTDTGAHQVLRLLAMGLPRYRIIAENPHLWYLKLHSLHWVPFNPKQLWISIS